MRRFLLSAALVLITAASTCLAAPTDDQVAARKTALDLAGAFSNEGFKIRDGHWFTKLTPGKPQVIQVNLYAGNEYWFCAGANLGIKKLSVSVHDENGEPVDFEPYNEGTSAAAGFSPTISGPYYVRIEAVEGEKGTVCLLYTYK